MMRYRWQKRSKGRKEEERKLLVVKGFFFSRSMLGSSRNVTYIQTYSRVFLNHVQIAFVAEE